MAATDTDWEPITNAPANSDWEAVDSAPQPAASALVPPSDPQKQAALLSQLKTARLQGVGASALDSLATGAEGVARNFSSDLLNTPSNIYSLASRAFGGNGVTPPFQPNKSVLDSIPEPSGDSAAAGLGKLGIETLKKLTTPESIVTLPAAAESKIVKALFAGQIAKDLPAETKRAVDTLKDPNASASDKVVAVGNPVVQSAMLSALTLLHGKNPQPEVNASDLEQSSTQTPDANEMQGREAQSENQSEILGGKAADNDGASIMPKKKPAKAGDETQTQPTPVTEGNGGVPAVDEQVGLQAPRQPVTPNGTAARLTELVNKENKTPEEVDEQSKLQAASDSLKNNSGWGGFSKTPAEPPRVEGVDFIGVQKGIKNIPDKWAFNVNGKGKNLTIYLPAGLPKEAIEAARDKTLGGTAPEPVAKNETTKKSPPETPTSEDSKSSFNSMLDYFSKSKPNKGDLRGLIFAGKQAGLSEADVTSQLAEKAKNAKGIFKPTDQDIKALDEAQNLESKPLDPIESTPIDPQRGNPVAPKKPKPETVPVRTAKSASDVSQMMAEKGFEQLPESEKSKYSPANVKEQVDRTSKFMSEKMDDARAAVRGEKPLPDGIHAVPFFNAMTEHAKENNDLGLFQDLVKSPLAKQTSEAGQSLGLEAHTGLEHSPVEAVREITQARASDFFKRTKQKPEAAVEKVKTTERNRMRESFAKTSSKRPDWAQFVRQISCNN